MTCRCGHAGLCESKRECAEKRREATAAIFDINSEKSSRLFAHCFRRRMRFRPLRDAIGHVSPSFHHRLAALDHSDVAHAAARSD